MDIGVLVTAPNSNFITDDWLYNGKTNKCDNFWGHKNL